MEDIHTYAHGPTYRVAWEWWYKMLKEMDDTGINHEIFLADKGQWESIYVNFQPTMLGAASYLRRHGKHEEESCQRNGSARWWKPVEIS